MSFDCASSCQPASEFVLKNTELMVKEQKDLISFSQMAPASFVTYNDEITSKHVAPVLCLKPGLVDASYKPRASCFKISFRDIGFPSEGA